MIQIIDVHDLDVLTASSIVRHAIDTIGQKILLLFMVMGLPQINIKN